MGERSRPRRPAPAYGSFPASRNDDLAAVRESVRIPACLTHYEANRCLHAPPAPRSRPNRRWSTEAAAVRSSTVHRGHRRSTPRRIRSDRHLDQQRARVAFHRGLLGSARSPREPAHHALGFPSLYLDRSMILQIGGSAFGFTSMRSRPSLIARRRASARVMTPSCSPNAPMTRTFGVPRSSPLRRIFTPE
jgi:hypothetical protein